MDTGRTRGATLIEGISVICSGRETAKLVIIHMPREREREREAVRSVPMPVLIGKVQAGIKGLLASVSPKCQLIDSFSLVLQGQQVNFSRQFKLYRGFLL